MIIESALTGLSVVIQYTVVCAVMIVFLLAFVWNLCLEMVDSE